VALNNELFPVKWKKVFYCCSKTFESIEKENVKTWRFYRISVIMEYKRKPCLAPPFIIFGHVSSWSTRESRVWLRRSSSSVTCQGVSSWSTRESRVWLRRSSSSVTPGNCVVWCIVAVQIRVSFSYVVHLRFIDLYINETKLHLLSYTILLSS